MQTSSTSEVRGGKSANVLSKAEILGGCKMTEYEGFAELETKGWSDDTISSGYPNVCNAGRPQWVDATHALKRSAGVS